MNPISHGAAAASEESTERNERKVAKTLVVQVDRKVKHPTYEKFISKRTKLYAHDEMGEARIGDIVEVVQTRPLSKLKRWRLARIVLRAPQA
jgi:small subunit ribosomal protein S17